MVKRTILIAAALLLLAISATPANNAEQVIFSTPGSFPMTLTGTARNGAKVTPLGFWVWCIAEPGEKSNGIYGKDAACQGSMYFYFLGHPEHVFGGKIFGGPFNTGISEGPDGIYTMKVSADDFDCTLRNANAATTKALTNTVHVECSFHGDFAGAGSGTADVTNSVVNVTGP